MKDKVGFDRGKRYDILIKCHKQAKVCYKATVNGTLLNQIASILDDWLTVGG